MTVEQLIELAAEANPSALMQNFVNMGVLPNGHPAIPERFIAGWVNYAQKNPSQSNDERIRVFSQLFDMPISVNSGAGSILYNEMQSAGVVSLSKYVLKVFQPENQIKEGKQRNDLEVPQSLRIISYVVLGLAVVGVITILFGLGRAIKKIYS